jgi:acyl dehydratase
MPIPASCVGSSLHGDVTHVDTRWLVAYSVGVGHLDAALVEPNVDAGAAMMKTGDLHEKGLQGTGVIAHPVFVWAVEWPLLWHRTGELFRGKLPSERGLTDAERRGGALHFWEDIVIHRAIQSDETILTTMTLVGVEQKRQGAVTTYMFEHADEQGQPLLTTWQGAYWRGVDVEGSPRVEGSARMPPPIDDGPDDTAPSSLPSSGAPGRCEHEEIVIAVRAHEGVIYSECARIWNPIHSDRVAALASGLPEPILHGTATMAKCVSAIVERYGVPINAVRRVRVSKFGAHVLMPSTVKCRVLKVVRGRATLSVHYVATGDRGNIVIHGGLVVADAAPACHM